MDCVAIFWQVVHKRNIKVVERVLNITKIKITLNNINNKIILLFFNRCKSFQNTKRGEICRIPGCTVSPSAGSQPTPIRMPHVQPETFRLFIQYVYTGKVNLLFITYCQFLLLFKKVHNPSYIYIFSYYFKILAYLKWWH